jgi:hypothetical protein
MKTLIKILFLCVLTALLTFAAMAGPTSDGGKFKLVSDKDKNLFVLKADKNLIGARVEIVQANGNVIAEQVLTRRKLVIDFHDIKKGAYTIRIAKGDRIQEFTYLKN